MSFFSDLKPNFTIGSSKGGLFGGGGIAGIFNTATNSIAEMRKTKLNAKYGRLENQDFMNYQLSMNDKGLIGRDGSTRDFGKNMKEGITSTFGNMMGMFGKGQQGAGISPAIGIGVVALVLFLIFRLTSKKRKK